MGISSIIEAGVRDIGAEAGVLTDSAAEDAGKFMTMASEQAAADGGGVVAESDSALTSELSAYTERGGAAEHTTEPTIEEPVEATTGEAKSAAAAEDAEEYTIPNTERASASEGAAAGPISPKLQSIKDNWQTMSPKDLKSAVLDAMSEFDSNPAVAKAMQGIGGMTDDQVRANVANLFGGTGAAAKTAETAEAGVNDFAGATASKNVADTTATKSSKSPTNDMLQSAYDYAKQNPWKTAGGVGIGLVGMSMFSGSSNATTSTDGTPVENDTASAGTDGSGGVAPAA